MRVIGGNWKGHRLEAPPGSLARPTTDRVKESMFNLMGPNRSDGVVVDLFAGSGALGIEALSRGASHAVFVDKSQRSMAAVRGNLTKIGCLNQSTLIIGAWQAGWERVAGEHVEVSFVFVDPPYAKGLWNAVLQTIAKSQVVVVGGIVCEHPKDVVLPDEVLTLYKKKERTYGDISVTIYADHRATER